MLIVLILGFLMLGGLMGIILIPMMIYGTKRLKQDAREILKSGIQDQKKFDRTYSALAKIPNDMEAAQLWKQLNVLKEKPLYNCPQCGQGVQYGWPYCHCGCRLIWI